MARADHSGIFGEAMQWYVDQAEQPWLGLASAISLLYLASFWLNLSYLDHVSPTLLVLQTAAAAATAYRVGVRGHALMPQVTATCALVGAAGGAVSALWAFIRFGNWWLVPNLITEPMWSLLLATAVGLLTLGFFKLPAVVRPHRAV